MNTPKTTDVASQHSMFWIDSRATEILQTFSENSDEYTEQLRRIQHACGNFVRIATNKNIEVRFSSGQQSFTSGHVVVLSADTDPANLDSLVGTALHEGAHCLLSTRALAFLPYMQNHFDVLTRTSGLPELAKKLNMSMSKKQANDLLAATAITAMELVRVIMNVLEDRRIDHWMYKHNPGYRPYYTAMYDKYWHSEVIDRAMTHPYYRRPVVDNYVMHVINMTNPCFDVTALPGLDRICQLANLTEAGMAARSDDDPKWNLPNHIFNMSQLPNLFVDAVAIAEVILTHSTHVVNQGPPPEPPPTPTDGDSDLPNLDIALGQQTVQEAMDSLIEFLNGEVDKKTVSDQWLRENDPSREWKDVCLFGKLNMKARVHVFRHVTPLMIMDPLFPLPAGGLSSRRVSTVQGTQLGHILANKLRVTQRDHLMRFPHQRSGRLDTRRLAAIAYEETNIFTRQYREHHTPVELWIDIDASASMEGVRFQNAMTLAIAIATASSKLKDFSCTVAARSSQTDASVVILYDSRTQTLQEFLHIVPLIGPRGGTPEGLCFDAVKEEILHKSKNSQKYFINISDGEPMYYFNTRTGPCRYTGQLAIDHTKDIVRRLRESDITVLSYFVGSDDPAASAPAAFAEMYGSSAVFVNPTQILDIASTLNKMLGV